jgi:hypothetical protein
MTNFHSYRFSSRLAAVFQSTWEAIVDHLNTLQVNRGHILGGITLDVLQMSRGQSGCGFFICPLTLG